jgi:glutathione S-transferase
MQIAKAPDLFGMSYSPWTQKARWAMDRQGITYKYHEHLVLLGLPELWWKTGASPLSYTLPILKDGARVLMESWDIARYADEKRQPGKETLFPEDKLSEIEECDRLAETGLDALRALLIRRLMRDKETQREVLPGAIPGFARSALTSMARMAVGHVQRAFPVQETSDAELESRFEAGLRELRARLKGGGHVVGNRLTYADIGMAMLVQGLEPPSPEYLRMGPGLRRCWSTPRLASEYRDLIEWRDGLLRGFGTRRGSRAKAGAAQAESANA